MTFLTEKKLISVYVIPKTIMDAISRLNFITHSIQTDDINSLTLANVPSLVISVSHNKPKAFNKGCSILD